MTDGRFVRGVANDIRVKIKNAERHEENGKVDQSIESYPQKTYERILRLMKEINLLLEEYDLIIEDFDSKKHKIIIRRT